MLWKKVCGGLCGFEIWKKVGRNSELTFRVVPPLSPPLTGSSSSSCSPVPQSMLSPETRPNIGTLLLRRLNLTDDTLKELFEAHAQPQVLLRRLQSLGVSKLGERLQILRVIRGHVEGPRSSELESSETIGLGLDARFPAELSRPDGCLSTPAVTAPISPITTVRHRTYMTSPAAVVVAAAAGCASPTPTLIRAFCSSREASPGTPRTELCGATPLSTRTNLGTMGGPRSRKSPNASRRRSRNRAPAPAPHAVVDSSSRSTQRSQTDTAACPCTEAMSFTKLASVDPPSSEAPVGAAHTVLQAAMQTIKAILNIFHLLLTTPAIAVMRHMALLVVTPDGPTTTSCPQRVAAARARAWCGVD